jgi:hypothetical protein
MVHLSGNVLHSVEGHRSVSISRNRTRSVPIRQKYKPTGSSRAEIATLFRFSPLSGIGRPPIGRATEYHLIDPDSYPALPKIELAVTNSSDETGYEGGTGQAWRPISHGM